MKKSKNTASELVQIFAALDVTGQPYSYNSKSNTIEVAGNLKTPITGYSGNLYVHGLVKESIDIGGQLEIGHLTGPFRNKVGIDSGTKPITVKARSLVLNGTSLDVTGNVKAEIAEDIDCQHGGAFIHGSKVQIKCRNFISNAISFGAHIYDGAQVNVRDHAEFESIKGGRSITLKKGFPKQPTRLLAGSAKIGKIDDRAAVYVDRALYTEFGVAGGSRVYAGGSVSSSYLDSSKKDRAPLGMRAGHGTSIDAPILVLAEGDITCGPTFNAIVACRQLTHSSKCIKTQIIDVTSSKLPAPLDNFRTEAYSALATRNQPM